MHSWGESAECVWLADVVWMKREREREECRTWRKREEGDRKEAPSPSCAPQRAPGSTVWVTAKKTDLGSVCYLCCERESVYV